jgi:diaminopimelate decarboxylase
MRPGMYGAYHEIEIINKDLEQRKENIQKYDIVGSLCENNDKFAIDRLLPKVQKEDLLIIKDVGAHGFSMGFNYNAKLKSAEYLIEKDNIKKIRRKETFEDYIQTIMEV